MNSRGSPVRGEGSDRFWPQQADLLGPTAGPRRESRSHQEKLTAAGRKRRGKSDCAWGPCPPRAVNTGCPPAGGVCLFIPYSKFLLQGLSKLGDSLGARPGAGSLFRDCPAASHISTAGAVPVRGGDGAAQLIGREFQSFQERELPQFGRDRTRQIVDLDSQLF